MSVLTLLRGALDARTGIVDGLGAVLAVAAAVAFAAAVLAWPLLGSQRSSPEPGSG